MLVLSSSEVKTFDILTPKGIEIALDYLGHVFLETHTYKQKENAIAACRRDLDSGFISIVTEDNGLYRIWCVLPPEMRQTFNLQTNIPRPANAQRFVGNAA